jgi:hypothetical protein
MDRGVCVVHMYLVCFFEIKQRESCTRATSKWFSDSSISQPVKLANLAEQSR